MPRTVHRLVALSTLAGAPLAHAGIIYTFSSAVGTNHASASVPGAMPRTLDNPYDFSASPEVFHSRTYTAASETPTAGSAYGHATSWTTINRYEGFFFVGIFDHSEALSTHPEGQATASTTATHEYVFTVDAAGAAPASFNWSLSTFADNPGTQNVSLAFGILGQPPLVGGTFNAPNQYFQSSDQLITLVPGTFYRLAITSASSAGVSGVASPGVDAEARATFALQIVPQPGPLVLAAGGLALVLRRRR